MADKRSEEADKDNSIVELNSCVLRHRTTEKNLAELNPPLTRPKSLILRNDSSFAEILKRKSSNSIISKEAEDAILNSDRSKKMEQKFLKLFPKINESLQTFYSCAYSGKILFHGTLFISGSYFCFYSKMMPSKTICIKITNIIDISKAKTVKLVPNAVGVLLKNGKYYLFGSLISRSSTFMFMKFVWKMELERSNGETPIKSFNRSISEDISDKETDNSLDKETDLSKQESFTSNDTNESPTLPNTTSENQQADEENLSIINLIMSSPMMKFSAVVIILLICLSIVLTFKIIRIQNNIESYIGLPSQFSGRKYTEGEYSQILLGHVRKIFSVIESNLHMMNESMKSLEKIQAEIVKEL